MYDWYSIQVFLVYTFFLICKCVAGKFVYFFSGFIFDNRMRFHSLSIAESGEQEK